MIRSNRKTSLKYPIIVILLFTVSLLIYIPIIPKAHAITPDVSYGNYTTCDTPSQSPCPVTVLTDSESTTIIVGFSMLGSACPSDISSDVTDTQSLSWTLEGFYCNLTPTGGEYQTIIQWIANYNNSGVAVTASCIDSDISISAIECFAMSIDNGYGLREVSISMSDFTGSNTITIPSGGYGLGIWESWVGGTMGCGGSFISYTSSSYSLTCFSNTSGSQTDNVGATYTYPNYLTGLDIAYGIAAVSQPINCQEQSGAPIANVSLSVSSGSSSLSSVLCNGTTYYTTVSPTVIIQLTVPSDSTYTRYRWDTSGSPNTIIATTTSATQWNVLLYYQVLNTYNLIPASPSQWNNDYNELIIGTSVSITEQTLNTIPLIAGNTSTARNAWSDYNTNTVVSPVPFGLWNTPNPTTFTPLTGANVYPIDFYLSQNIINTTTITITYTNPSGQTGDLNAGINQLVTEIALLVPALLIMGAMLYTSYQLGMRTVGRMGIVFELTLLGVTAIGFVPLWLGTIVFVIAMYIIVTQRNETIGDKE